MRYRRRPTIVEAFKWTGGEAHPEWFAEALRRGPLHAGGAKYSDYPIRGMILNVAIPGRTSVGMQRAVALVGDYIVLGSQGEIYPCAAEIFEATHELVEGENNAVHLY